MKIASYTLAMRQQGIKRAWLKCKQFLKKERPAFHVEKAGLEDCISAAIFA